MIYTPFAGLVSLSPGESLSEGNYAFQSTNPKIVDRLLQIGAVTHRHDAHPALANPTAAIVVTSGSGGSGQLLPDTSLSFGYTITDAQGGESAMPTPVTVSTPAAIQPPDDEPTFVVDPSGGTLRAGAYYYAVTLKDGMGGETTPGPSFPVSITQGGTGGSVQFSGLAAIVAADGAAKWVLYRGEGGGTLQYLAEGTADTFLDDGIQCAVQVRVPTANTTNGNNFAVVTVPPTGVTGAASFSIYASEDGSFQSPALWMTGLPLGSAGVALRVDNLQTMEGAPPPVSTMVPGAHQITVAELAPDVTALIGEGGGGGGGESGPSYVRLTPKGGPGGSYVSAWEEWPGNLSWGSIANDGFLRADYDLGSISPGLSGYGGAMLAGAAMGPAAYRRATVRVKTDSAGLPMANDPSLTGTAINVVLGSLDHYSATEFGVTAVAQVSPTGVLGVSATDRLGRGPFVPPANRPQLSLPANSVCWIGLQVDDTGATAYAWTSEPGKEGELATPVASVTAPWSAEPEMETADLLDADLYPSIQCLYSAPTTTGVDVLTWSNGPETDPYLSVQIPGGARAALLKPDGSTRMGPSVQVLASGALRPGRLEFVAGPGIDIGLADDGDGNATITIGLSS